LDLWIRKDYKRTDRLYVWHDTEAREVSEKDFYELRYGGGTTCSSAMKLIQKIIKHRYPPEKYNIYIFYFGDGENWGSDNKVFCDTIKQNLNTDKVNMIGITQILSYMWDGSVKHYVDGQIAKGAFPPDFIRTTAIGGNQGNEDTSGIGWHRGDRLPEHDEEVKKALIDLLGVNRKNKVA
jgi:uncharacterized sporulation protein YeaH/YhbH (DUF444 family)